MACKRGAARPPWPLSSSLPKLGQGRTAVAARVKPRPVTCRASFLVQPVPLAPAAAGVCGRECLAWHPTSACLLVHPQGRQGVGASDRVPAGLDLEELTSDLGLLDDDFLDSVSALSFPTSVSPKVPSLQGGYLARRNSGAGPPGEVFHKVGEGQDVVG